MKYRFFHILARDPAAETEILNRFLAERRIVAVDRQFVADGGNSFWAFSVAYRERRATWEAAWREGRIDTLTLQRGYDAVRAITLHADGRNWRCNELARHPAPEV